VDYRQFVADKVSLVQILQSYFWKVAMRRFVPETSVVSVFQMDISYLVLACDLRYCPLRKSQDTYFSIIEMCRIDTPGAYSL